MEDRCWEIGRTCSNGRGKEERGRGRERNFIKNGRKKYKQSLWGGDNGRNEEKLR